MRVDAKGPDRAGRFTRRVSRPAAALLDQAAGVEIPRAGGQPVTVAGGVQLERSVEGAFQLGVGDPEGAAGLGLPGPGGIEAEPGALPFDRSGLQGSVGMAHEIRAEAHRATGQLLPGHIGRIDRRALQVSLHMASVQAVRAHVQVGGDRRRAVNHAGRAQAEIGESGALDSAVQNEPSPAAGRRRGGEFQGAAGKLRRSAPAAGRRLQHDVYGKRRLGLDPRRQAERPQLRGRQGAAPAILGLGADTPRPADLAKPRAQVIGRRA